MPLKLVPPRKRWSPSFRIRGTYLGVSANRTAGTAKRAVAQQILKKTEAEIERGAYDKPQSTAIGFAQAA